MALHPLAGQPAPRERLVNVPRLVSAYYTTHPDPADPLQGVSFGTSGHRGTSAAGSFNDDHIAAIAQAIADYRAGRGIDGPLYAGMDTHALSEPALATAVEVFAANGVRVVAIRLPHLESASVSVFVRSGSQHESRRHSGISHVVEHMAFKGTTTRSARDIAEAINHQQYRGSRYSLGYPACPDLEQRRNICDLLDPQRIGVSLSEQCQLQPEQATDAFVVHHPEARYFNAS